MIVEGEPYRKTVLEVPDGLSIEEAANLYRATHGQDPSKVGDRYVRGRCACGCDELIFFSDAILQERNSTTEYGPFYKRAHCHFGKPAPEPDPARANDPLLAELPAAC